MDLGKGFAWLAFLGIMMVFAPSESRQTRPAAERAPALAQGADVQVGIDGPLSCGTASLAVSAEIPVN